MAYVSPQSPWFHSLNPTNNNSNGISCSLSKPTFINFTFFNTLRATSSSSSSSSSWDPSKGMKPDPVKTAFEKAKAYKKAVQLDSNPVQINDPGIVPRVAKESQPYSGSEKESPVLETRNGGNQEVPTSIKFAIEKAKDYKKNNGVIRNDKGVEKSRTISGLEDQNQKTFLLSQNDAKKKGNLSVSGIDFVGLGFADKKISRGLPPGLQPFSEEYPDGNIPDVEILVGDTSRFKNDSATNPKLIEKDGSEIYKPKVSTWGVFPRPSNISKTFGGGRVIQPGEQLETVEDKAAKQKRTRELLAAYRKRTGINIDPNLKLECEKILEDGDYLMDLGKLEEAITFYQEVMDKLPFQTELYGLAALQWSICQDSLSRSNEARVMYEKLQSHTSYKVSNGAKQFMFGFQAMEMMKVKSTSVSAANTGYQIFFEAFVERKVDYSLKDSQVEEQDEGAFGQAIPYIVLLVSPIFLVLLFAVQKGM